MGKILDRALETSTIEGTAAIQLAGAATGHLSFSDAAAFQTRDSSGPWLDVNYQIEQRNASGVPIDWEIGVGTLYKPTTGNPYITRDTIRSSSNGGAKVNFGTGTKSVWSAPQAADFGGLFTVYMTGLNPGVFTGQTDTILPDYEVRDVDPTGFNPGITRDNTIILCDAGAHSDFDSFQWNWMSDDKIRYYAGNVPASPTNPVFRALSGFPFVHHLIAEFTVVSTSGPQTLTFTLPTTVNNYQRCMLFQNFKGYSSVIGDARLDLIWQLRLTANDTIELIGEFNDTGTCKLCVSIVEF